MKYLIAAVTFGLISTPAFADACHDRFSQLLVEGNKDFGPARSRITQEIVGGQTSINYHYSDGEGNGLTEMIDPENDPWSLFIGDNMYMSKDKGVTWSFINSWDAEKSKADTKAALAKDSEGATDLVCATEEVDGVSYETVEGKYISSSIAGASIQQKYWVNKSTGLIAKTYSHLKSSAFESKTTQEIEKYPDFKLPSVE